MPNAFGTPAFAGWPGVAPEAITIVRPNKRRGEGTPKGLTGWHIIQYADGGRMCMHESGFRVIDNR